jgi:DnaJ-class molecular chaperone
MTDLDQINDDCPICLGLGIIEIINADDLTVVDTEPCELCKGTGVFKNRIEED